MVKSIAHCLLIVLCFLCLIRSILSYVHVNTDPPGHTGTSTTDPVTGECTLFCLQLFHEKTRTPVCQCPKNLSRYDFKVRVRVPLHDQCHDSQVAMTNPICSTGERCSMLNVRRFLHLLTETKETSPSTVPPSTDTSNGQYHAVEKDHIPDSFQPYQHDVLSDAHNLMHEWHSIDHTEIEAKLMAHQVVHEIIDKCQKQFKCECEDVKIDDITDVLYDEYWVGSAKHHIQQPTHDEL